MITNTGKGIIGKYLLGQAPAYASYIAVGCGQTPLTTGDPVPDNSTKENLSFEMFRVPITSRGFIDENGDNKIVLTAELPTEERYEISEVGIYSAGANPSAASFDSRTIFSFSATENWQYHNASSVTAIPTISAALDAPLYNNIIATTDPVFQTNSDNPIFYKSPRLAKYEQCRFLNNTILMSGDSADLTIDPSTGSSSGHFVIESGSTHIHLTGATSNVNFTKNSPIDELRLAFSIINKDANLPYTSPDTVRILIDFATTDEANSGEFARFEAELENGIYPGEYDLDNIRHWVVSKQLQDLYTTPNFTWNSVTVIKIYVSALVADVPSGDYYIALDAMRLENIATQNPLYGMTGYAIVQNADASTIVKSPNTSNYIEFRFSVGVT